MNRHLLATQLQSLGAKLAQLEHQLPQMSAPSCSALEAAIASISTLIDLHLPATSDPMPAAPLSKEPMEEQWRALNVCLPVGIFTADIQGGCTYISQRCQEIVGCSLAQGLETGWLNFVHGADRDRVLARWLPRAQSGLPNSDEFRVNTPTGETRWLSVRSAPIYSDQNQLLGHIGTIEDITKQKQAEAQVKASLDEKEALLKEIHHRVKNNLQIISSLIYLQAQRIEDKRARQIFEESQCRISSMALVHDTLYRSQNFASVDLSDYVQNLTASLFQTYRIRPELIKLEVQVNRGVIVTLDKAIPCGLILNELMTNALRHGFPDGQQGKVTVKLNQRAEQVCLIVQDDGSGLPETFELQTLQSMGLKLVKALVHQIQGQLDIEKTAKTRFKVTFNCS